MRKIISGLIALLIAGGLMFTGSGHSARPAEAGTLQDIIQLVFSDPPSQNSTAGAGCTAPAADSGVDNPSRRKIGHTEALQSKPKNVPTLLPHTDGPAA